MGLFTKKPLISAQILFYGSGEIAVQPSTYGKKVMESDFVELVTLFYIKTLFNLGREKSLAEMVKKYFYSIANAPKDEPILEVDLDIVVEGIERVLGLNFSLHEHFKVSSFRLSDPREQPAQHVHEAKLFERKSGIRYITTHLGVPWQRGRVYIPLSLLVLYNYTCATVFNNDVHGFKLYRQILAKLHELEPMNDYHSIKGFNYLSDWVAGMFYGIRHPEKNVKKNA